MGRFIDATPERRLLSFTRPRDILAARIEKRLIYIAEEQSRMDYSEDQGWHGAPGPARVQSLVTFRESCADAFAAMARPSPDPFAIETIVRRIAVSAYGCGVEQTGQVPEPIITRGRELLMELVTERRGIIPAQDDSSSPEDPST